MEQAEHNMSSTLTSASAASALARKADQLTDQQRSRLFACLCVARHIHGASDNDESFNMDIYEETLALLKPHWEMLEFEQNPSYMTVCKIWKNFVRTGLILPPKLKTKAGSKGPRLSKAGGDEENSVSKKDSSSSLTKYSVWEEPRENLGDKNLRRQYELKSHIDDIKAKYSAILTPKQLKAIRARLEMMRREVSVLLLLGRSHDIQCKVDKTFCIGQAIANVSQYPQFGYINARDKRLDSEDLTAELSKVLDERNDVVMIDSLDNLPGSKVMSLFQFIDRDEMNKRRRGLLLLLMYTGARLNDSALAKMRDAEIVEQLLVPTWSKYVRGDTLTSVISRISGTIVRVQ